MELLITICIEHIYLFNECEFDHFTLVSFFIDFSGVLTINENLILRLRSIKPCDGLRVIKGFQRQPFIKTGESLFSSDFKQIYHIVFMSGGKNGFSHENCLYFSIVVFEALRFFKNFSCRNIIEKENKRKCEVTAIHGRGNPNNRFETQSSLNCAFKYFLVA